MTTTGLPSGWMLEEDVTCVVCPRCAFTFDAVHRDDTTEGGYSCPCCETNVLLNARCHLCGKTKFSADPKQVSYLLAFHMDRRHPGWTKP